RAFVKALWITRQSSNFPRSSLSFARLSTLQRQRLLSLFSNFSCQEPLHFRQITVRIVHVFFLPGFFDGLFLLLGQVPRERRVVIRVFERGQLNVHFATGALPPAFLQQIEFDLAVRKLSRASHIIKRGERHAHLVEESALLLQPPIRRIHDRHAVNADD